MSEMARARDWRAVRADALEDWRITEQGVASARRGQEQQPGRTGCGSCGSHAWPGRQMSPQR